MIGNCFWFLEAPLTDVKIAINAKTQTRYLQITARGNPLKRYFCIQLIPADGKIIRHDEKCYFFPLPPESATMTGFWS